MRLPAGSAVHQLQIDAEVILRYDAPRHDAPGAPHAVGKLVRVHHLVVVEGGKVLHHKDARLEQVRNFTEIPKMKRNCAD